MYKLAKPITVDDQLLEQALGELAGEASMCWDPIPGPQVFDASRARDAVLGALSRLKTKTARAKKIPEPTPLQEVHASMRPGQRKLVDLVVRAAEELKEKTSGAGAYEREGMTSLEEAVDNIRINAHYFHHDNPSMHPAHRRLLKMLEQAADSALRNEGFAKVAFTSFADELEGISKEAAFMRDVGMRVLARGGKIKDWALRQGAETGAAFADHLQPIQKMRESWNQSKWWGMKGLTVAGAAMAVPEALPKEDPLKMGRGRGERITGNVAGTVSGLITMKRGLVPALATGIAAQYAGGKVGKKLFDRRKTLQTPQPAPTPLVQQTVE